MNELGLSIQAPFVSFIDNSAAIDVAKDYGVSGRTKHFELSIHVIRKMCEENFLHLEWIPTDGQLWLVKHSVTVPFPNFLLFLWVIAILAVVAWSSS